ncbi:MAG: tetratricopeptide repeat protein [Anaerolineae bacterium]|nr:tetratricopeptide repeat protein [Anaerolineae bacterium]MCA9910147.1 tetratricopeptide repeat protein [Anaerolineae bacterium]
MNRRLVVVFVLLLSTVGSFPALAQEQSDTQPDWQPVGINFYESGQQALQNQDYDRVVLDASLFVLLNPTDSQGYFMRSIGYLGREDADSALSDIQTAIRFATEDAYSPTYRANLFTLQANIFTALEDTTSALESYTEALDINPTVQAYTNRAFLFAQQESFDQAIADIDQAVALGGDQSPPFLHLLRGFFNSSRGDSSGAAVDYMDYATLIGTDIRQADAFDPNEPRQLEFAEGRVYLIPVTIERPQNLSAIAAPGQDSQVDPLIILLAPDGTPIVANDDTSNTDSSALIENFPLASPGLYTLVVTYSGDTSTGTVVAAIALDG